MAEIQLTEDQKIRANSLHEMLNDYNNLAPSEDAPETEEAIAADDSLPITLFVLQGRFGQGLSLIEQSLLDKNTVARLWFA